MSKRLLNRSLESDLETALDEEAMVQSLVTQSEDTKEGMLAFAERRQPVVQGPLTLTAPRCRSSSSASSEARCAASMRFSAHRESLRRTRSQRADVDHAGSAVGHPRSRWLWTVTLANTLRTRSASAGVSVRSG